MMKNEYVHPNVFRKNTSILTKLQSQRGRRWFWFRASFEAWSFFPCLWCSHILCVIKTEKPRICLQGNQNHICLLWQHEVDLLKPWPANLSFSFSGRRIIEPMKLDHRPFRELPLWFCLTNSVDMYIFWLPHPHVVLLALHYCAIRREPKTESEQTPGKILQFLHLGSCSLNRVLEGREKRCLVWRVSSSLARTPEATEPPESRWTFTPHKPD